SIQRLTPGNWYGEYLISKIAEARRSRRRGGGNSDNVVVRGSSPEDPAPALQPQAQAPERRRPGLFGRSRGTAAAAAGPPPSPDGQSLILPGNLGPPETPSNDASPARPRAENAASAAGASGPSESGAIAWQVHESPDFRIYHCDPALAERAAAIAES